MAQYKLSFFSFFSVSVTSRRVTALSSDNGRQLACHANNPALFRPVETTMTMSVYCECLNVSVKWQSTPPLFNRNTLAYKHTQPHRNPTIGEAQGYPASCTQSVLAVQGETFGLKGKITPSSRQHDCDCLRFLKHAPGGLGLIWPRQEVEAVFLL